ncbi:hypothetical protein KUCAC02_020789, partial [Chaenocephalus aceratus]
SVCLPDTCLAWPSFALISSVNGSHPHRPTARGCHTAPTARGNISVCRRTDDTTCFALLAPCLPTHTHTQWL